MGTKVTMYKMIFKFKKLRNIVLKNNTKKGKRGLKTRFNLCRFDSGSAPDHSSIRNKEIKIILN